MIGQPLRRTCKDEETVGRCIGSSVIFIDLTGQSKAGQMSEPPNMRAPSATRPCIHWGGWRLSLG